MTTIINCLPSVIRVCLSDGTVLREFPPAEHPAQCFHDKVECEPIDDLPITRTKYGEVYFLPDPAPDTYYIVNPIIMHALPHRTDLLRPSGMMMRRLHGGKEEFAPIQKIKDKDNWTVFGCTSLGR